MKKTLTVASGMGWSKVGWLNSATNLFSKCNLPEAFDISGFKEDLDGVFLAPLIDDALDEVEGVAFDGAVGHVGSGGRRCLVGGHL